MRVEPREYSSLMNARAFVRAFLMHRKDRLVRFSVTAFSFDRKVRPVRSKNRIAILGAVRFSATAFSLDRKVRPVRSKNRIAILGAVRFSATAFAP